MRIMRCPRCGTYTIKDLCPNCGAKTVRAAPPRFSPEGRRARLTVLYGLKEKGIL